MQGKNDRIILGIDPGTNLMGYGVIRQEAKKPQFIGMDVIDLKKSGDHYMKLRKIYESTLVLIERFLPDELAIESPFYGRNVQSMLKLGRAQGVAIAAAISREVPVFEYAPRKIKLSITGAGNASKEQVAGMLARMFGLDEIPRNLDATDGLAAAVCHFYRREVLRGDSPVKSWETYVKNNPGKVK